MASLGPYDWGGNDGNYLVEPYVGFWPDLYTAIEVLLARGSLDEALQVCLAAGVPICAWGTQDTFGSGALPIVN